VFNKIIATIKEALRTIRDFLWLPLDKESGWPKFQPLSSWGAKLFEHANFPPAPKPFLYSLAPAVTIPALAEALNFFYCISHGHNFVDRGYAGPDSGCIDMVCQRCGYDAGTTWLY
jgi:hypothetical protein